MTHASNRIDPSRHRTIAISVLLAVLWSLPYWSLPTLIDPVQLKLTDLIVAHGPEVDITDRVVVIDIDEQSLEAIGQWPWPRSRLAALLEKIAGMNASSIALDFIMAEPDRTSPSSSEPETVVETSPPHIADEQQIQVQDPDMVMAATLAQGPFVLGYTFTFSDSHRAQNACQIQPVHIVNPQSQARGRSALQLFQAHGVICNLPQFCRTAPHSGFLNGQPDGDQRIRRLPLLIRYGGAVYPNLALAALLAKTNNPPLMIREGSGGQRWLNVGPYAVPIDETGSLSIRFAASQSNLRHIPAKQVMTGEIEASALQGCIALVGLNASGLATTYATPGNGRYTAVEIHGQAIETILSGSHIRRSRQFVLWEICLALIIALFWGFCVSRLELVPTIGLGLIGIAACWSGAQFLFNSRQILMSPLLPTATIAINGLLLQLYKFWNRQNKARQGLQEALVLMKNSEQNLDSIITTIPDIVFRLDATGRITFISPAVVRYDHQPTDLIGKHILDLVSPEDRKKATYRINERRTGSRATSDMEIRLNLPPPSGDTPGEDLYFSISAVGIYETPTVNPQTFLGTQGIAKDISQRKQLEQQLEQAQKMEAMGSLAAGVAHDLNNILSGLVSYPELLLLDLPGDSPMRSKIETIRQSGKRAADIVQDLLMLARRGIKDHTPININQTINDYLDTLEFKQLEKTYPKIQIETSLSEDVIATKGSSVHISKMVMNLVRNAVEAMPAGGKISIGTTNRYLDIALDCYERIPEGEYVVMRVTDEGVGIPDNVLTQIFEPFYSNKRMGSSGSGLGMTVVWNTVKDHSGFVDIRSNEGEGTCFEVYLPAARDVTLTTKKRIVLQDYTGNETILVVDDIPEQRDIAVRMLGRLGYRVSSVSSGEAALTYLGEQSVDLVVLDMVMPNGIDGLETYRGILELQPYQKAIIASGYATSDRVKEMHSLGAGEYIRKPYTLEKIGLAVRKELDRGAQENTQHDHSIK